jgi:hypothetical protein
MELEKSEHFQTRNSTRDTHIRGVYLDIACILLKDLLVVDIGLDEERL